MTWDQYIHSLISKPTDQQSDEDRFMILLADIKKKYKGINTPQDITDELWAHYQHVDHDLAFENREVFYTSDRERLADKQNPCHPERKHLQIRGEGLDSLCELLGISKTDNFQDQIKANRIYEEDLINSDWYNFVLKNTWQLMEIYPYDVGQDFKENPLRYFKTIVLKVLGISCSLNHPKGSHPDDFAPLLAEHKRKEIYQKHYSEKFPQPRRYLHLNCKACSDDWINKKIEQGEELTKNERTLRELRKHVEIHRRQPQSYKLLSAGDKFSFLEKEDYFDFMKRKQQGESVASDIREDGNER